VHRANYRPYGEKLVSVPTLPESKAYVGERIDEETGLMYLHARYYDPALARFTQADPSGATGGTNEYAYALNSPIFLRDPMGLNPQENDLDPSSSNYGHYSDAKQYGWVTLQAPTMAKGIMIL
jgi:RHS repeat-associated protein